MELKKVDEECCRGCGGTPSPGRYAFPYHHHKRGRRELVVFSACDVCADMDIAISEADDEGRKYTAIGAYEFGLNGGRCICGAVTHAALGFCIQCWRRERKLGKAQAESRAISKALVQLRKEIREQQKLTN